jgi:hypothetical protein
MSMQPERLRHGFFKLELDRQRLLGFVCTLSVLHFIG